MRTKTRKTEQIQAAIKAGNSVAAIAKKFKVKPQTVYSMRWQMKNGMKKVAISKVEATIVKKLGVPLEVYAKEKIRMNKEIAPKPTPNTDFVREELANVERQIDNLNVIASFLAIRLRQLEQNGE
jgi:transposase-like protein